MQTTALMAKPAIVFPAGYLPPYFCTKDRWQLPDYRRTYVTNKGVDLTGKPTDYSEASLSAFTIRRRNAEIAPSTYEVFPDGAWVVQSWDRYELWQLRTFHMADGNLLFNEILPWDHAGFREGTVKKYTRWIIDDGSIPPPVRIIETDLHRMKIVDGHHRLMAMWRAGYMQFQAWVSPCYSTPIHFRDGSSIIRYDSYTMGDAYSDARAMGLIW